MQARFSLEELRAEYDCERFYETLNSEYQSFLQSSLMLQERISNTMRLSVEGTFVLDALDSSPHGQCGLWTLSLVPQEVAMTHTGRYESFHSLLVLIGIHSTWTVPCSIV